MKNGKVISLYLINGNSEGIVCSYLSNWTGQAIKIPRNLISNAEKREEIKKTGVYFLLNKNDDNEIEVYIGESENIYNRILQHIKDKNKNFFNEVIAFTSKDEELTKSHIQYLEYRLIEEVGGNDKYILKNTNKNRNFTISEMYITILEEYLENVKIILPTLGYDLFIDKEELEQEKEKRYLLESGEVKAEAVLTKNNRMIVLKGSKIRGEIKDSLSNGYMKTRERLVKNGIIDIKLGEFLKDCEFNSPSAAAAIILGISVNGRRKWSYNGKTLEKIQDEENNKISLKINGGI